MAAGTARTAGAAKGGTSCSRAARATGCATMRRCARRCATNLPEIIAGGDVINDECAHRARAGADARALPLPAAPPGRAAGRGPGQGQARAMCSPIPAASRRSGRQGCGGSERRRRAAACWSSRSTTSSTGCGRRCSCRTSRRAPVPPRRPTGCARAGTGAARARGSIGAARFKELVKRRGSPGADPDLHRRGSALPAAGAPPAAGRARGGVLHAGCLRQHVRPRPQARQDLLLLGGAGAAARVPLARDGVRRAHHRGLGVQRGGVLPGDRQRRHRVLDGLAQGARDHRRALQPGDAATSTCSTPPTATTP